MRNVFLIFFFSFFALSSYAQQDSLVVKYDTAPMVLKEINEDELSPYLNNPDYNYEEEVPQATWWDDVKAWFYNIIKRIFEWIFGMDAAVGPLAFFLKIVPYLLLFFLIFLLIRFFLNANLRAMKNVEMNKSTVGLSEEEHIIKNENIDDLIQKALIAKDYRLAVRYWYLQILKLLSEKELIIWELQKTNSDYLYEISTQELKTPFATVTRWYDYIWYGDFDIDEHRYQKVAHSFDLLKNRLQKNA